MIKFIILSLLFWTELVLALNVSKIDDGGFKSVEKVYPRLSCPCGIKKTFTRIVGGVQSTFFKYPWLAAICRSGDDTGCPYDKQFCGGTLICDSLVITAAHCVENLQPGNLKVVLGEFSLNKTENPPAEVFSVKSIIRHPGYNSTTLRNDIAMLVLDRKAEQPRYVPICIPTNSTSEYVTRTAVITGWGSTSSGGYYPKVFREVEVPVVSREDCRKSYPGTIITERMLCAGSPGKDSCQGDSGGPLAIKRNNNSYMLIGIVSFGTGCGKVPGVYTQVNRYLDWIMPKIKNLCTNKCQ